VLPFWAQLAVTVFVIFALALINARGTTWGGGLQVFITAVKVFSLVAIAVLPFVMLAILGAGRGVDAARLQPVRPADLTAVNWGKFGAALVGVFWAYHGWQNIGSVAEEIRNPGRNIPLSLIGGMLAVMVLYVSANLAYYLVVPQEEMIRLGRE